MWKTRNIKYPFSAAVCLEMETLTKMPHYTDLIQREMFKMHEKGVHLHVFSHCFFFFIIQKKKSVCSEAPAQSGLKK